MQIGNFVGDAVKGSAYNGYPPAMSDGILLHRLIDSYTDNHPAVKEVVQSLKPHFGRYSGILLDIYFDYLLASRFDAFSKMPLKRYARGFYCAIIRNYRYLPGRFRGFMWHFIGTNRLWKYATKKGIRRALEIMVSVNRIDIPVGEAIRYLTDHEEELWSVFRPFFGELQALCDGYIRTDDRAEYLRRVNGGLR